MGVNSRMMRLSGYVREIVGYIFSLIGFVVFAVMGSFLWVMKLVVGMCFMSGRSGLWDSFGGGK